MTKFYMTDGEIITDFRQAKDPTEQIKILADLNCVSREQMREKLRSLGLLDRRGGPVSVPPPAPEPVGKGPHIPPIDELRAMELWREGLDDLAISESLGVPISRVSAWRRRMHLYLPRGGAAQKKKKKEKAEEMIIPKAELVTRDPVSAPKRKWEKEKEMIIPAIDPAAATIDAAAKSTAKEKASSAAEKLVEHVQKTAEHYVTSTEPAKPVAERQERPPEATVFVAGVDEIPEPAPELLDKPLIRPMPPALSVAALAKMLDTASKLGGEVEIEVDGKSLRGAEFLIRCGVDGEPEHTVLRLNAF